MIAGQVELRQVMPDHRVADAGLDQPAAFVGVAGMEPERNFFSDWWCGIVISE